MRSSPYDPRCRAQDAAGARPRRTSRRGFIAGIGRRRSATCRSVRACRVTGRHSRAPRRAIERGAVIVPSAARPLPRKQRLDPVPNLVRQFMASSHLMTPLRKSSDFCLLPLESSRLAPRNGAIRQNLVMILEKIRGRALPGTPPKINPISTNPAPISNRR